MEFRKLIFWAEAFIFVPRKVKKMEEMELPEEIKRKILQRVSNKPLALKAFEYIRVVRKEDGTLWVKENFEDTNNHALWFMVLACVNYAKRLIEGEDLEDDNL